MSTCIWSIYISIDTVFVEFVTPIGISLINDAVNKESTELIVPNHYG